MANEFSEVAEDMHAGAIAYEERAAAMKEIFEEMGDACFILRPSEVDDFYHEFNKRNQ